MTGTSAVSDLICSRSHSHGVVVIIRNPQSEACSILVSGARTVEQKFTWQYEVVVLLYDVYSSV